MPGDRCSRRRGNSPLPVEHALRTQRSPLEYAMLSDARRPLLEETRQFAVTCGALDPAAGHSLETLGRTLEPDFVLLVPSPNGPIVVGGVVCFPSSWALPEKIGRTLHETHEP